MYNNIFVKLSPPAQKDPHTDINELLNVTNTLELYLQRRRNEWAEGALDTLRWVKVTRDVRLIIRG